jgi:tRNA threonylcarbamoyl adenosine modification protein (Sua5/YciO/YrdC/YwlC family)
MIININPDNPQLRLVKQVAEKIRHGAVICYPTETGYGIGCDIFSPKAIKQIVQLKRRPKNKPFSFMCPDLKNISLYAHVSNTAYRLLKKNLPGPYTFVLPGTKLVPKVMTTRQKTVGIRVPENEICRMLLEELETPIINTSIPVDDETQGPNEAYKIDMLIGNRVDLVIDGGPVYPDPSSLIDLTGDSPAILREGKGDVSPFL